LGLSGPTRHALVILMAVACHRDGTQTDAGRGGEAKLVTARDLEAAGVTVDASQGRFHVDRPEGGRVEVNYEYKGQGVALASSLNIETDAKAAQVFYDDTLAGQQTILGRQGLTMGSCATSPAREALLTWGDMGACFEVLNADGPVGFFVQAKKGARVMMLMVFAKGIAGLEPKLLAAAADRLPSLEAYMP
jgi:hypothetical protein